MARQRFPDDSGSVSEDPYRDAARRAYAEGYSINIQNEASDLRDQMQRAVQEAASEHIGQPLNDETRSQLSTTVATAIIDSMNSGSPPVVGESVAGGVLTNRTLESGSPMVNSINMEMTVVNTANVAKDEHGNPLFCYGCAGSAADVSFPSYAVEWRCIGCIRCTDNEINKSKRAQEADKVDKYITCEYQDVFTKEIEDHSRERIKKEVIEDLNTDKTILTGQKLKRLIKNG